MVEVRKTMDKWITKVQKDATGKIEQFVAMLFFLIAIGAFFGAAVAHYFPHLLYLAFIIPAALGLFAYLDRAYAIAIFALFILVFFII